MADDVVEDTSGWIAFLPSEKDAEALVLAGPNAQPIEMLHSTIAYLADDVTGWDLDARRLVLEAVVQATTGIAPVEATVIGHATLNPDGDGDSEACAVYLIGDAPALRPIRDGILAGVDMPPIELAEQHEPNVWHVTAGYGLQAGDLTFTGNITFDRIVIAYGEEHTIVPLADVQATAAPAVVEPTPVEAPA